MPDGWAHSYSNINTKNKKCSNKARYKFNAGKIHITLVINSMHGKRKGFSAGRIHTMLVINSMQELESVSPLFSTFHGVNFSTVIQYPLDDSVTLAGSLIHQWRHGTKEGR